MERREERAEGGTGGHLREGVDIFREALARRLAAPSGVRCANGFPPKTHPRFLQRISVAEFAVWTGYIGMGVVDVAREEATRMHLRPVRPHLLAVLLDGIEVGDLVGTEDVVRVFRDFGLERRHHGELLRGEDLDE